MKPATLVDIAERTNTSVSTVSRVLAGGAVSRRISRETCRRVKDAAEQLGYRPNLVARALRTRKSNTIALLVSDIANSFFSSIASLIEQSLHRHGYSLMLCNSGENIEREQEYLRLLAQKTIDGLIVVPMARSRKALLANLPTGLPLVVLDRPVAGIPAAVFSDRDQSTNLLCDTLSRVGVKRVAIIAGSHNLITHHRRAEIVGERFEVISRYEGPPLKETGRRAFILLGARPDAIVCTNNVLAEGVIDCIAEIDHPPIIATFDEVPIMHLLPIPIAIAMQDIPMLAEGCVRQLLLQLDGSDAKPSEVILSSRVITNRAFQKLHSPPV